MDAVLLQQVLIVSRIGTVVPIPGIDPVILEAYFLSAAQSSTIGFTEYLNFFSGGAFSNFSLFMLGVMPYISTQIIVQLLMLVVPSLKKLAQDPHGSKKIQQYTRWGTIIVCLIQSFAVSVYATTIPEAIIMGYRSVPIIEEAERQSPGITDAEYPLLNPEDLIIRDYRRIPEGKKTTIRTLFLPNLLSRIGIATDGRAYPEFIHSECRHCLKCVNVCPAKALEMKGGRIHISRRECIRCYCCHEMCPFDAIKIK